MPLPFSPCSPLRPAVTEQPLPNPDSSHSLNQSCPSSALSSDPFKRLGQASLVSSSIFKSTAPTRSSIKPHQHPQQASQSVISNSRIQRPTSQMADALKNLGFDKPHSTPTPNNRPKRKSDENLHPTRLPPAISNKLSSSTQKPRKSEAYDALTRNALVSSSPFKAPQTLSKQDDSITSSVLKHQRLAGPRSFTPPPPTLQQATPQSVLSTSAKHHSDRRKTVTWGGEDILEFERVEDYRRTSDSTQSASSSSSSSQLAQSEDEDEEDDSIIQPPPAFNQPDFWSDHHPDSYLQEPQESENSNPSLVLRHHDYPSPNTTAIQSFSSDNDPVERMVNDLLTSPDLAAHVTNPPPSLQQQISSTTYQDEGSPILKERIRSAEDDLAPPSPLRFKTATSCRFPYKSLPLVASESPQQELMEIDNRAIPSPPMVPNQAALVEEKPPFRHISLPRLDGPDDSLFTEGSFVSSILQEPSFLGLGTISLSPPPSSIPRSPGGLPTLGLSLSTPRPSFATDPPIPHPIFPDTLPLTRSTTQILSPIEEHDTSSSPAAPQGGRRPLPRPPSVSPPLGSNDTGRIPPSAECSTNLSALTAPAHTLPDISHASPFMNAPSANRHSLANAEESSNPSSPTTGRLRITREKIQERMHRGATRSPENQSTPMGMLEPQLSRDQVSHVASLHCLTSSGHLEEPAIHSTPSDPSASSVSPLSSLSTAAAGPGAVAQQGPYEIPARPPLKARLATLSDSLVRPSELLTPKIHESDVGCAEDQALRQEDMDAMESGLDKLASGFREFGGDEDEEEEEEEKEESKVFVETHADNHGAGSSSRLVQVRGVGSRRRRSLSTGAVDVDETGTGAGARAVVKSNSIKINITEPLSKRAQATSALLTHAVQRGMEDSDFQAPLDRALQKIMDDGQRTYRIQESEEIVYASDVNRTTTVGNAGDVSVSAAVPGGINHNRNWRKLRKVSDINEHEKQLRAFWAQNGNSNKIGKVFVKMSKLVFGGFPVLSTLRKPVWFEVIIDNGLHTAKTAAYKLEREVSLGVEFELVRAKKLEFSLAFNIPLSDPRNAHLLPPPRVPKPATMPQVLVASESPKRGFAKLFGGGQSKRNSKQVERANVAAAATNVPNTSVAPPPAPEPLLAFLDREGTLAKAQVNFDQYADEALGQLKMVIIPCILSCSSPPTEEIALRQEMRKRSSHTSSTCGQITLEFLSLPPLPKVEDAVLPNSSGECLKGLRIAEWWQEVWHTGVLSQMGADCQTWRRRTFKATGGSLFAYNDIMNKISAEIRLSEVLRLEDTTTHNSPSTSTSIISETGDILPPFTFKLIFKDFSEILFHADGQAEFRRWKNVLGQLIGKIQALPVWAELLRLQIVAKRAASEEETRQQRKGGVIGGPTTIGGGAGVRKPGRRAPAASTATTGARSGSSSTTTTTTMTGLPRTVAMSTGAGVGRNAISNGSRGSTAGSHSTRASSSGTNQYSQHYQHKQKQHLTSQQQYKQQQHQTKLHSIGPIESSKSAGSNSRNNEPTSRNSTALSPAQQYPSPAVAIKRSVNRMDLTK